MIFTLKNNTFDSEILGLKTAKISIDPEKIGSLGHDHIKEEVDALISLLSDTYEYAIIRYPAELFSLTHVLEASGFNIVDITVQLKLTLDTHIKLRHISANIRPATQDDIARVEEIAQGIFVHSRFFNDPLIPNKKAHKIYTQWAKNCILKVACDETLVAEIDNSICGFIGIKNNGHVSLIGVAAESQGIGIGKQLVNAALKQFIDWGLEEAILETQATNIPAIRAYQNCGYRMNKSFLTFRWAKS
jgi:ribosomal-protein-alanine N-acetyltransferase